MIQHICPRFRTYFIRFVATYPKEELNCVSCEELSDELNCVNWDTFTIVLCNKFLSLKTTICNSGCTLFYVMISFGECWLAPMTAEINSRIPSRYLQMLILKEGERNFWYITLQLFKQELKIDPESIVGNNWAKVVSPKSHWASELYPDTVCLQGGCLAKSFLQTIFCEVNVKLCF